MSPAFSIRPTEMADVPEVTALVKASWARTYDAQIGESARREISDAKHVPELFSGEIGNAGAVSFVAIEGRGRIVGHVGGDIRDDGVCFVDRLHVDPQWWGTGLAAALVSRAEVAVAGRCSDIQLTVLEGNDRAIAFYQKAGFDAVANLGAAHGLAGKSAILMRLTLRQESVPPRA